MTHFRRCQAAQVSPLQSTMAPPRQEPTTSVAGTSSAAVEEAARGTLGATSGNAAATASNGVATEAEVPTGGVLAAAASARGATSSTTAVAARAGAPLGGAELVVDNQRLPP